MNPIFIFLVILSAIILWFLLSFLFRPIGNVIFGIWEDAVDEMNKNEKTKNEKEEQEE